MLCGKSNIYTAYSFPVFTFLRTRSGNVVSAQATRGHDVTFCI